MKKILLVAVPNEKKLRGILTDPNMEWEEKHAKYHEALVDPQNLQYVAVFEDREPFTIVNGKVRERSLVADIEITKDMGNIRFARIVKTHKTQPITKQDMIQFSKENKDFEQMFRSLWKDVTDTFYEWKLLSNAIFGKKEVWNDCAAFTYYVFYKVDNKVSAIRVRKAEGKVERKNTYEKENVGEVLFTIKSEDVVPVTIDYRFDGNGNMVKAEKLVMHYDVRVLSSEIITPEWSEWEEGIGGQFYATKSDGIWFEIKSLDLRVNTTFDCSITYIVSRPEGFENPQGQEIDKCPIKCRVRYIKVANATSWVANNYRFQVEILEYQEPSFRAISRGYSSYGSADERRNGVES